MKEVQKYLLDFYQSTILPSINKNRQSLSLHRHSTNSQMEEKGDTPTSKITDDALLLSQERAPSNKTLLIGTPDMGKTTLLLRFLKDWVECKLAPPPTVNPGIMAFATPWVAQFDLVLLIDLTDLYRVFAQSNPDTFSVWQYMLNTDQDLADLPSLAHSSNFLLLIDNYEKVVSRVSPAFSRVLDQIFKAPNLIVATEPGYTPAIEFDNQFTIEGLGSFAPEFVLKDKLANTRFAHHTQLPAWKDVSYLFDASSLSRFKNHPLLLDIISTLASDKENIEMLTKPSCSLFDIFHRYYENITGNPPDEIDIDNLSSKLTFAAYLNITSKDEKRLYPLDLKRAGLHQTELLYLNSIGLIIPGNVQTPQGKRGWCFSYTNLRDFLAAIYIAKTIATTHCEQITTSLFAHRATGGFNLPLVFTINALTEQAKSQPAIKIKIEAIAEHVFDSHFATGSMSQASLEYLVFLANETGYAVIPELPILVRNDDGNTVSFHSAFWFKAIEMGCLNLLEKIRLHLTNTLPTQTFSTYWHNLLTKRDQDGLSPTQIAIKHNHVALLHWLASQPGNNIQDELIKENEKGHTPLRQAIMNFAFPLAKLISSHLTPAQRREQLFTAQAGTEESLLCFIARVGDLEALKSYIELLSPDELDAQALAKDHCGEIPAGYMASRGRSDMCEFLIEKLGIPAHAVADRPKQSRPAPTCAGFFSLPWPKPDVEACSAIKKANGTPASSHAVKPTG